MKKVSNIKRLLSMVLCVCMVLGQLPLVAVAAEGNVALAVPEDVALSVPESSTSLYASAPTALPRFLYVGGVEVVQEYTVGAVISGEGWRYDVDTATLYLTDGANIRYSSTTEDSLENGIYCSGGTLNIHASGTVNITGYGNGIDLPDGTLDLYAAEGSNITITGTSTGSEGIFSTVDTNYIRFSGKGTVNVNASDGASYGMIADSIYIDGVTLNVRGTSNYDDISADNVLIGQTEGAVVNCLGTTCSGIGGSLAQKIGIYNGSIVHLAEKTTDKSWLLGFHAKTIEIADSTVVMDGLTGAYSIYAMHGTSTVSGASHILIRKMVSTEDSTYGLTVDHDPYQLTGEAGYYTRSDAAAEFTPDGDITEIYIGYFELYYPSHLSYRSNGDGTHALTCPTVCNSGIKGESIACNGTANCTTPAFCDICQSSYGEPDLKNHDSNVTLENGFCPYCPAVEAAEDSDGDGYYEIGNGGQLYWFAQQVNGGNSDINGKLTADIVINEDVLNDIGMPDLYESTFREWVPIGSRDTEQYTGSFDGQGHTVSGLFLEDYEDEDVGLFGAINGATIKNVGLVDSWINAVYNVAGIAGYAIESTIENCFNTSTIKGIGQSGTGASSVGGITGYFTDNTVMINCYNSGRIIGDWWVGGLSGRMYARAGRIQNCYNVGSVEGNKSVGGLIGESYGIVTNCFNLGSIEGNELVGEIIAENIYDGNVTNCYYCPSESSVGIAYDTASNPSRLSTFTAEQFFASSGETGAVVDVLNAWVAEQNDEAYKNWHLCADISYYYPALNMYFSYVDNGETHTTGCENCDYAFAQAHTCSYTVEENRITETCQQCSHSASVSLEVPEDSDYDRSVREARYVVEDTTPVSDILIQYFRCSEDPEAEPQLLASAPADAGTYIVRLTVGEAYVEDTMTIAPIPITLLGAEAETRDYDGTPYVTLDTSCGTSGFKVEGILDGDIIEILCRSVEVAASDAGNYDRVTVKGLTTGGEDGHNYTVVSEANLPIYNIWGNYESSVSIYHKSLTIRLSDQQAGSLEELDQNAWEIDEDEGLVEGHSIASIKLVAELNEGSTKYASISLEEGSLKIVDAEGNDVTENYYVWAYPATLTITCSDHDEFVQGFCTNCGGYEEATFNKEGYYYEIANAGQLYWFAEYVNYVDSSIAAVLVNDIAVPETAPQWTPIGSSYPVYSGSFDGQGHTISGLYVNQPEWDYVGLFGNVSYNPEVKNLTIINSTFIGNNYVGALAGYGEVLASNIAIGENVTVQGNANVGGMIGYNAGELRNCYAYSDSFVGYMYSGYGSIENCYFLSETDDEYGTIGKTSAQFASGEVAYLLQAGQVGEPIWDEESGEYLYDDEGNFIYGEAPHVWGQTIGEEEYPVLGGKKVYQVIDCTEKTAYSNSETVEPVYVEELAMKSVNIDLASAIAINFNGLASIFDQYTDVYAVYSAEGKENVTVRDYFTSGSGADLRYNYAYEGLTALDLGLTISVTVYGTNSNGELCYGATKSYSILKYCTTAMEKATNDAVPCANLLLYGNAAQAFKGVATEEQVLGMLTESQAELLNQYAYPDSALNIAETSIISNGTQIRFTSQNVDMLSRITMIYIMDFANYTGSMDAVTFKIKYTDVDGNAAVKEYTAADLVQSADDATRYELHFAEFYSTQMREMATCEIYIDGVLHGSYANSLENYCYSTVNGDNTDAMKYLATRMSLYGDAAYEAYVAN